MRGATSPLPNTPSLSGAQLKHRDNFAFTFRNLHVPNNVSSLTSFGQEQLIDVSCDRSLKDTCDSDELPHFWLSVKNDYPVLSDAIKVLLPFVTTSLCETGFSAAVVKNEAQIAVDKTKGTT
jgi:hypothetical protein